MIGDMPAGPQREVLERWARGFGRDPATTPSNQVMGLAKSPVATERLRQAGIPGIRYLDAGSRGAGDGSRNYVVFDDRLISIINKYGIAGAAAMLGVSASDVQAAMGDYQPSPADEIEAFFAGSGL